MEDKAITVEECAQIAFSIYQAREEFQGVINSDKPINPLLIKAFDTIAENAQEFIQSYSYYMEKHSELLDKANSKEVEDTFYKIYENL